MTHRPEPQSERLREHSLISSHIMLWLFRRNPVLQLHMKLPKVLLQRPLSQSRVMAPHSLMSSSMTVSSFGWNPGPPGQTIL